MKERILKIVRALRVKESLIFALIFLGYFFLLRVYQNLDGSKIPNFNASSAQMLHLAVTPVFAFLMGIFSAWKAGILITGVSYLALHFLFLKSSGFENPDYGILCTLIFLLAAIITKSIILTSKKIKAKREKETV